ncbi:MAG: DUF2934 domain-containing protein [Acidobacteria bacterium]|nr:DUF2934 domain-containing protein [Acidobacteriota bacterium]
MATIPSSKSERPSRIADQGTDPEPRPEGTRRGSYERVTHEEPSPTEIAAEAAAIYPAAPASGPTAAEIAREAHAIYVARGGQPGSDLDDWLTAERRLRQRPRSAD